MVVNKIQLCIFLLACKNTHYSSGIFLSTKICYPESFCFFCLCSTPPCQVSGVRCQVSHVRFDIFKAWALWADAFYKSKCPSVCLSVRLCVCPSVCLPVCVFTFEVPFKRHFGPTSQSRMSNIFRDSESLGKNNGKKWSQI